MVLYPEKDGIPMTWLVYALGAAASMAVMDALTKRFLSDCAPTEALLVRVAFPAALLTPLLFLAPAPTLGADYWSWLVVAIPLEILAEFLYIQGIRSSPLALSVPYLAFTPVFITFTGWLLLGEAVGLWGFLGVLLVVLGAYYLNLDPATLGRPGGWLAPLRAIGQERGARYVLGVALIYSLTAVLAKGSLLKAGSLAAVAIYFGVEALCILLLLAVKEPRTLRRAFSRLPVRLGLGVVGAVSVTATFLAFGAVETAYAIAVKRTSILFAIVLGAVWFHERRFGHHFTAGAVMVGGVALMLV